MPGLLAKERIIAPADYNRWLVPPAALAIHLSIGMAYGFSVFWFPLSQALGTPMNRSSRVLAALAWLLFGIPLAWGIYRILKSAIVLFR